MRHESLGAKRLEAGLPLRSDVPALALFSCARLLELRSVAERCPKNCSSGDDSPAAEDQRETDRSEIGAPPIPTIKK